ncbi:hypothetical protein [Alteribacter populi]|uniref:hypothetical protein n=1 Tax=Alteribacter populi TaxID=2011011 RepID=UPI000BBAB46E|nr:hypothetical protein [Alteribacter populi]
MDVKVNVYSVNYEYTGSENLYYATAIVWVGSCAFDKQKYYFDNLVTSFAEAETRITMKIMGDIDE